MSFGINDFIGNVLKKGGVSKPSLFDVQFTAPSGLLGGYRTDVLSNLTFRCDNISIPGRTPLSSTVKYYGPQRKQYYGYDNAPVTATFIMSENMIERDTFLSWQDIAIGSIRKDNVKLGGFNVGYYDDYVSDLTIRKYNEGGRLTYSTKLVQAFPTSVLESGLNWNEDGIMRLSVTFDYHYFTEIPITAVDSEQRRSNLEKAQNRKNEFSIE
jgi:hypothetical protein